MNAYDVISKHYSDVYDAAQAILDKHSPCKLTKHGNGKVSCKNYKEPGYVCCGGCKHLGMNGCKVKCLGCKISLCPKLSGYFRRGAAKELYKLRKTVVHPGYLLRIRTPKKDIMRHVKYYKICKFNRVVLCARHAYIDETGWPCESSAYSGRCSHYKGGTSDS